MTEATFHPHEVLDDGTRARREDLPSFTSPDAVMRYIVDHQTENNWRDGKFVKLEWIECDGTCGESHAEQGSDGHSTH